MIEGRSVLLIDEDEESVLLARRTIPGIAVYGYADGARLISEGNVRANVLINVDGFDLAGLAIVLQTTWLDDVVRIFALSSENAFCAEITGYPFVINGRLVFFSNGGVHGDLLFEKKNQGKESCGLCGGTGELIISTKQGDECDVCPRCHDVLNPPKEGKNWCKFFHHLTVAKPPMVISMVVPPLSGA